MMIWSAACRVRLDDFGDRVAGLERGMIPSLAKLLNAASASSSVA